MLARQAAAPRIKAGLRDDLVLRRDIDGWSVGHVLGAWCGLRTRGARPAICRPLDLPC
jgi:hypothetical protein